LVWQFVNVLLSNMAEDCLCSVQGVLVQPSLSNFP